MNRSELERYIGETYNSEAEFPWEKSPKSMVFRHSSNKKWFALVMEVPRKTMGLSGSGTIDILNVKSDPLLISELKRAPGFFPAYHMNKLSWLSIALDGSAEEDQIRHLLDMSFDLTASRIKRRRTKEYIDIPEKIREYTGDREFSANKVGMSDSKVLMFDDMVLKIQAHSEETDNEYRVCKWLDKRIPTPEIIAYEVLEEKAYCLMSRIPGRMLCDEMYLRNPEKLLNLVAQALERLWSVDITDCPCDNTLAVKLRAARYFVENRQIDLDCVEPETFGENGFENPERLLAWLEENRPEEELVFSHGDFSLPNVFAEEDEVSGFIDLGKMGIADRWQDLAICYRSLKHNFEGKYNGGHRYDGYYPEMLFERLGIEVNQEKLRYYILLDELF